MNEVVKGILIFAAGAVACFAGLYAYGRYAKSHEENGDSFEESENPEEENQETYYDNDGQHLPDIHEYAKKLANKREANRSKYGSYYSNGSSNTEIYAITEEEYSEENDNLKIEYTWYADGVLVNDYGEEIDISDGIGKFFAEEIALHDGTVWEFYARNPKKGTDYYLARDARAWHGDVEYLKSGALRQITGDENDDENTGDEDTDE